MQMLGRPPLTSLCPPYSGHQMLTLPQPNDVNAWDIGVRSTPSFERQCPGHDTEFAAVPTYAPLFPAETGLQGSCGRLLHPHFLVGGFDKAVRVGLREIDIRLGHIGRRLAEHRQHRRSAFGIHPAVL